MASLSKIKKKGTEIETFSQAFSRIESKGFNSPDSWAIFELIRESADAINNANSDKALDENRTAMKDIISLINEEDVNSKDRTVLAKLYTKLDNLPKRKRANLSKIEKITKKITKAKKGPGAVRKGLISVAQKAVVGVGFVSPLAAMGMMALGRAGGAVGALGEKRTKALEKRKAGLEKRTISKAASAASESGASLNTPVQSSSPEQSPELLVRILEKQTATVAALRELLDVEKKRQLSSIEPNREGKRSGSVMSKAAFAQGEKEGESPMGAMALGGLGGVITGGLKKLIAPVSAAVLGLSSVVGGLVKMIGGGLIGSVNFLASAIGSRLGGGAGAVPPGGAEGKDKKPANKNKPAKAKGFFSKMLSKAKSIAKSPGFRKAARFAGGAARVARIGMMLTPMGLVAGLGTEALLRYGPELMNSVKDKLEKPEGDVPHQSASDTMRHVESVKRKTEQAAQTSATNAILNMGGSSSSSRTTNNTIINTYDDSTFKRISKESARFNFIG